MARLNSSGSAVTGIAGGTIGIDGSRPAALASYVGGYWGWYDSTHIYGPASVSGGHWQVYKYQVGGTAALVAATVSPNAFAAGGTVWGAFTAASPPVVDTSLAVPHTAIAGAGLLDVSPDGEVCTVTAYASGMGITVYNSASATLLSRPSVQLVSPYGRCRDHYLSYQDKSGWHLVNVLTGATPDWFPRTDGVLIVIPVLVGGVLWVVEAGATLTARPANKATGYVIETAPIFYSPDAVATSSSVLRMAYGRTAGEPPADLLETDLTIATGANTRGTVSGGTIVRTPGPVLTPTQFPVGPAEGDSLTSSAYLPLPSNVIDAGGKMTLPWASYLRQLNSNVSTVSTAIDQLPPPTPAAALLSFGTVAVTGQPVVAAIVPTDQLTLTSTDHSVTMTTNPGTRTVDLAASGGSGGAGDWIPLVTGAEPPVLVSDGAGVLILVAYP